MDGLARKVEQARVTAFRKVWWGGGLAIGKIR